VLRPRGIEKLYIPYIFWLKEAKATKRKDALQYV
jgi:hypothetical protein